MRSGVASMKSKAASENLIPAEKDHADVVVPPPLALACLVAAGWLLNRVWPAPFMPPGLPRSFIGAALIVLSLAIGLPAVMEFRRAQTSIRPDRPTSAILSTGPYRYSRNPLYLSMFVLVAGFAVALDSLWQLAALAALYGVLRWGVVPREEAYLTRKFGAAYLDYARRVRRWL
jgi:protein-S-isoprenylcysteine O-methyltransferase Ste14